MAEITKALKKPVWEAAYENAQLTKDRYLAYSYCGKKLGTIATTDLWAYENWTWRIQMSLQTALSKQYYSPANEQEELESRRIRRKIQNDPWHTTV